MPSSKTEILILLLIMTSLSGCVSGGDTSTEGVTISGEVYLVNNDTVGHSLSITIKKSEKNESVFSENASVGTGTNETMDVVLEEGSYDVVARTDNQLVSKYNWKVGNPPYAPDSNRLAVIHRGDRLEIAQVLEPRGMTIENDGNASRRFNISVVDSDSGRGILSRNVSVDAGSEYTMEDVTSLEGTYKITVRTDNGMEEQFLWEVRKGYFDAHISYEEEFLRVTQSVE